MHHITLTASTSNPRIDAALNALVGIFETTFPRRIRGYYVEGSYADGSAVTTSDIDLTIIFKQHFADDAEHMKAQQLGTHCTALSGTELDIEITDECGLEGGVVPMMKLASTWIYGEDIRERLTLLPLAEWTHQRMHAAYWLVNRVFERPNRVTLPLDYPDANDTFGGYTRRIMRLPNGQVVPCTRDLMRVGGWIATALLAHKAGHYVARKRDCSRLYRTYIGDEWTDLLERLYTRCRGDWNYLVPMNEAEQEELRIICASMLAFENHFLIIYRDFLLAELRTGADKHRLHTLWVLSKIPLNDLEIKELLHMLQHDPNDEVRVAAERALEREVP